MIQQLEDLLLQKTKIYWITLGIVELISIILTLHLYNLFSLKEMIAWLEL